MAQGLRILGWTLSTLTPTCSSSSDLFPSSGPSLTVSYFLWFWHKHKRDEQKHERPPKAWAQNRNSAVSVHTLWPKADPMAKSSINEVGTLSPLVEVKGVDSCWEKSMDSKQECNMTLNRPQAFVQIHYNPRAILLMWLQNRAFLTIAYEIYWPGKEYIHQKKKILWKSSFAKETDNGQWTAGVNCLSTLLITSTLPIWTLQGFKGCFLCCYRAGLTVILEGAAAPMSWNESSPEATLTEEQFCWAGQH